MPIDWGPLGETKTNRRRDYAEGKDRRRRKRGLDRAMLVVERIGLRGSVMQLSAGLKSNEFKELLAAVDLIDGADHISRVRRRADALAAARRWGLVGADDGRALRLESVLTLLRAQLLRRIAATA